MSARQTKKRKGRNHINNRERTVTTFTEDPNTSFLVPLSSEDPPTILASPFPSSFSMNYQNYIPAQQQQFYQPILPPGKNDLEVLENLKSIIKEGQHEFYRAVPQPAALASLYMGHIPQPDQSQQEYPTPRFSHDSVDNPNGDAQPINNTIESHTPLSGVDTSPLKLGADTVHIPDSNPPPAQPDSETQAPADTKSDPKGEYDARPPVDTLSPNKATPLDATNDDQPPQLTSDATWEQRTIDDRKAYDDRNVSPTQATTYDNRPLNGAATTTDTRFPPPEDNHLFDKDRDRDRDRDRTVDRDRDRDWERDRDRHDLTRDNRDRGRDRDVRERRTEFYGRSYGRSHAPRPPPELRHYEPSYGADYVPPHRRFDSDDRRGGLRSATFDFKPPFDDRRPPFDDRRPPPVDDRRLALDDRPMRSLPGSDARLPPSADDRSRPASETIPLARATAEDDRGPRAASIVVDDRPRATVPLEERLSQPAPAPSLQDRLSQPANIPARVDMPAPTLEERLSLGPGPRYRAPSVAREDLRLAKDDMRDHDRMADFRRDTSRERVPLTASSYRPDMNRFGDRDDRDRRDRDRNIDTEPPARLEFGRVAPRRYSPPPTVFDRDRERERARPYYPTRSPPPMRGEYHSDSDKRYANEREREYERRRELYNEDDRRGPTQTWRPQERVVDRERFDRSRERERDGGRERDGPLGPPPAPPTRGHWDDRERRFPLSPPPARMDATDGPRPLSSRLTDGYPPPPPPPPPPAASGDDRAYGAREFERGRYGLDDHRHPPPFSRVRNRSPTPPRRGPLAEDLRPLKRVRDDNPGYAGAGGAAYSPPRREYVPGPPPSTTATTTSAVTSVSGTVPPRSSGARTPPNSGVGGGFYDRDRDRNRDRDYVRGEYGMGYDRGRRSPPVRMGPGYARMGRDDRRYVPPPPPPPRTT